MRNAYNPVFGELFDEFRALMQQTKISLPEMTAACLAWFLTFAEDTIPKENRIMLVQKIAKDLTA